MPRPRVFLAYPFRYQEIEATVKAAVSEFAEVVVAKDEVHGSHILEKILRQMNESDVCLFDLTGSNVNVVLELGIAIGRASAYCVLRSVSPSRETADAEFFSDLKGWDHIKYSNMEDLAAKLRHYVPKQIERAASMSPPAQMTVPVSTYEGEIRETLAEAHGQAGLMIPTFICSMSLAVHPSAYAGDRFTEDRERSVVATARESAGVGFPRLGPEGAANLEDGFEVMPDWNVEANRRIREYYRFYRDGLFVFLCASPDDIGEDLQYRQQDRYIGFGTLLAAITKMILFAAALARQYGDETTALIRVSGLMNHRLFDDLVDKPLTLGNIRPAHQNGVETEVNGSPAEFDARKLEWAVDVIARCLRALNYPATMSVAKEDVRKLQKRLL
jgi:hypothetical protein